MAPIDPRMYESNQRKLDGLLSELMQQELGDDADVRKYLAALKEIYLDETGEQNNFRHNYSNATSAMFSPDQSMVEDTPRSYDFYAGKIQTLAQNLMTLRREAEKSSSASLLMPLAKLYDHVNLELVRVNYNAKMNSIQDRKFGLLNDQISKSKEEAQQGIRATEKKAKEQLDETRLQATRDNVTILGIFTGVVIAFVAGLTLTSSVLQNIDKASIYRLCAITTVIAIFFIDLIAMLLTFIGKVSQIDCGDLKAIVKNANIAAVIFLIVVVIARLNGFPAPL